MSSEQEIAVVNVGFRTSPFVEQLLHRGDIALSMIANNSANFAETTERVLERLSNTKSNAEFLANLGKETE